MRVFLAAITVACVSIRLLAQGGAQTPEGKRPIMVSFTDLKWVELPERKGMQFAVLSGDLKTGPDTQIRKVPAGTDNPLHSHSSEIKNVIISGVWYTGADAPSAKDFGPGSVVIMPADWVHVSGCRAGSDCVFYSRGQRQIRFQACRGATSQQVVRERPEASNQAMQRTTDRPYA
jgi:quercetin dioxygenase-like cupin family protein